MVLQLRILQSTGVLLVPHSDSSWFGQCRSASLLVHAWSQGTTSCTRQADFEFVKGTLDAGLFLGAGPVDTLTAYSDADWAGCPDSRHSTLGYCVYLGDNLVSWTSKRQTTVSHSSAEAEYRAVAHVVAECCWLRQLLQELHVPLAKATVVYCDNVSVVYMTANPVHHRRTKHIEIDIILFARRWPWERFWFSCPIFSSVCWYHD